MPKAPIYRKAAAALARQVRAMTVDHDALVARFLTDIGVALGDEERAALVGLVRRSDLDDEPPREPGALYQHDDAELPPLSKIDILARLFASLADQKHAVWCDVGQFINEYDRLRQVPRARLSDDDQLYRDLLVKVARSGLARRRLVRLAPESVQRLAERFPNFAVPIQFLAEQHALAHFTQDGVPRLAPILLLGDPGVGKTLFAHEVAKQLGTLTNTLSMASQTCGFAVSGMARGWSSAMPGLLFKSLLDGRCNAPVIILDEIDKSSSDSKSDPTGPLFTLLERKQAARFRDEYLGFDIDASQAVWIATANDVRNVNPALLSRFAVFDIPSPTADDLRRIANSLLGEAMQGLSGAPRAIPETWVQQLGPTSPRELRKAIDAALGRAALRAISAGSAQIQLLPSDLVAKPAAKPSIGFVWTS
jgi:ATP-dependent Lon protease